ncbi:MAG TPA: tRNA threonylcarbamoyladenosine dehydratase, partial [Chryseobacterium indologenes]|nr:tRNA threonylcarbamoyladenosine dehydratase [Chryseobacterium indologenes]
MDKYWLERTELLVKEKGLEKLKKANVLVVGLGGVGSFAAEFLARAGVGNMTIVDGDTVDITNINRQLPALHSTVGKHKVEVVAERLLDINPQLNLIKINEFLNPERMDEVL